MTAQGQFWLVLLAVLIGSYGWGCASVRMLDIGHRDDPLLASFSVPFRVTVGLALFFAVGGVLVAAEIAYFPVLLGWFLIGVVLGVPSVGRGLRKLLDWRPTRRQALWIAVVSVIAVLVVALAYGAAMQGPTNPNDDAAAYLYLAERLLHTGGMVDPFNFRRITSYGGEELLQAVFLRVAGTSVGLAVEWLLFGMLTVAVFVSTTARRFTVPGLLVVGVIIAVVRPVGAGANIAPTFSGVAITFALFELLVVPSRRHDVRRYVLAGLFVGALLSLRYAFAIPAATVVILVPVASVGPRRAIRLVGVAAGTGCTTIVGWAIGLQASSRTPIYPFIEGDANLGSQWRNPHVSGLASYLGRVRGEVVTDGWGLEILAVVLAAVLVRRSLSSRARSWSRPEIVAPLSAALGCALLMGVTTFELSGGSYSGIGRYNAPSALAALLFVISLLWRNSTARAHSSSHRYWSVRGVMTLSSMAVLIGATPASSASVASSAPARLLRGTQSDLAAAVRVIAGQQGFADQWSLYRARYQEISNDIPVGARVLAAVDLPGLLDFSRFQFATLDEVGAASPPPHLPLGAGEQRVVSYLEGLGYSGIVASDTDAVGLYSFVEWESESRSTIWDVQILRHNYLAWSTILTELSHDPTLRVSRAPTLVYFAFPAR